MTEPSRQNPAEGVLFEDGPFRFSPDVPENGLFRAGSGALTITALPAVPGEYPETMALKGKRRTHTSESGREFLLETEDRIPFGEEPAVKREYRFCGGVMSVRTDFELRHSFPMRSLIGGGLRVDGLLHLKITEQPSAPGVPAAMKTVDFASLPDGTAVFEKPLCPLRIVLTDKDRKQLVFELDASPWRWNPAGRLPGRAAFRIVKENGAMLFHWDLFEFVPRTPEEEPPHGRNIRFGWMLRFGGGPGTDEPVRETIDAAALTGWPEQALVLGADGKTLDMPCFASPKVLDALKKEIRRRLPDIQEGDRYVLLVPDDAVCFSAAHEGRAGKKVLAHWDREAKVDFLRWANRQFGLRGAELVLKYRDGKVLPDGTRSGHKEKKKKG